MKTVVTVVAASLLSSLAAFGQAALRTTDSVWFSAEGAGGEPKLTILDLAPLDSADLFVWLKVAPADVGALYLPVSFGTVRDTGIQIGRRGAGQWPGNSGGLPSVSVDSTYALQPPFDTWTRVSLFDSSDAARGDSTGLLCGVALGAAPGNGWNGGRVPVAKFRIHGTAFGAFRAACVPHSLSDRAHASLLICDPAGTTSWRPVVVPLNVIVGGTTVNLRAKWNMLSVPRIVVDYHRTAVFPGGSGAFAFEGGYVGKDILENGRGYWLKFAAAQDLVVNGTSIVRDTMDVVAGWNMIGSITLPVAAASAAFLSTTRQSAFFGYNGGYVSLDTIRPGQGSWIKVGGGGSIVLAGDGVIATAGGPPPESVLLEKLNMLQIGDGQAGTQRLFFGEAAPEKVSPDDYVLPPAPPGGALDARFASQRMVETYPPGDESVREFEIQIGSAHYPLTFTWHVAKNSGERFALTERSPGGKARSVYLDVEERMQIVDPQVRSLLLRVSRGSRVPRDFALRQSYPNPFNPTAILEFDLPVEGRVTLTVFNLLGQEVALLKDNEFTGAGTHQVEFNAGSYASGVYFYRIVARLGSRQLTDVKKMVLMR